MLIRSSFLGMLLIITPAAAQDAVIFEHTLHDGRDPFTPPQSKVDCVNWAYPWPGAKVCVGHRAQCKFMNSKIAIQITGPKNDALESKARACIDKAVVDGVIAGAIHAAATGGITASSAFVSGATSLKQCVIKELSEAYKVNTANPTGWSDWGGC